MSLKTELDIIGQSNYTGRKIDMKISEYNKLTNRLRRYWRKLVKESLKIAQEKELETYVTESHTHTLYDIIIKKRGDEIIDDSELLILAKTTYPSLYRKYYQGLKRHRDLTEELKKIYDSI